MQHARLPSQSEAQWPQAEQHFGEGLGQGSLPWAWGTVSPGVCADPTGDPHQLNSPASAGHPSVPGRSRVGSPEARVHGAAGRGRLQPHSPARLLRARHSRQLSLFALGPRQPSLPGVTSSVAVRRVEPSVTGGPRDTPAPSGPGTASGLCLRGEQGGGWACPAAHDSSCFSPIQCTRSGQAIELRYRKVGWATSAQPQAGVPSEGDTPPPLLTPPPGLPGLGVCRRPRGLKTALCSV